MPHCAVPPNMAVLLLATSKLTGLSVLGNLVLLPVLDLLTIDLTHQILVGQVLIDAILTDAFEGFCLFGQAADEVAVATKTGTGTPSGPRGFSEVFFSSPLPLIAGLAMIWYLTWFLPEKTKRQNETNLLASLMKNDRVITIGGLHGTVVSAPSDSDVITLKIDEAGTTRVKINRSAIAAISVHAKGKPLDQNGRPLKTSGSDAPGQKSTSKDAADEDSSD
jgi:preprotein translocase subunit YajC